MKKNMEVEITAKVDAYIKSLDRASKAAERLTKALEDVNKTEIKVYVKRINKNWWEFYK